MHGLQGFRRTSGVGRPVRALGAVAVAVVVFVMLFTPGNGASATHRRSAGMAAGRTFVSLIPACACGRHTVLSTFSLSDGRRLSTISPVATELGESYRLSGGQSGQVLMVTGRPALCTSDVNGCGPEPDTCASHVDRLVNGRFEAIFTAGNAVQIQGAAASANGRQVAIVLSPCTTGQGAVVVRDPATGTQWTLGEVSRCSGIGAPSFSSDGRRLVFAFAAVHNPGHLPPPGTCPLAGYARLAIAPAVHSGTPAAWKLIKADRGCAFEAATFNAAGIAAVEGCRRRQVSGSFNDPGLGQAVLLQLDHRNRVTGRINLKPGWEQGVISTEPNGAVLISQDQPANEPYPERDWVWEFTGGRLRLIASYAANDAAQILAVPR